VCGTHAPIKERCGIHTPGRCEYVVGTGADTRWCPVAVVDGDRLCLMHAQRRVRERTRALAAAEREVAAFRAHARLDDEIENLLLQARLGPAAFAAALAAMDPGIVPPVHAPAPLNPLLHFVNDAQNVHTAVVVAQTNEGEEKLLSVPTDGLPVGIKVLVFFAERAPNIQSFLRVANDVEQWYSTETCRRAGDKLYARTLEGLWTLIEQQPETERAELKIRLWEEASDSVGMCCEGHIARLVNVMSGFDEAFHPRVSSGEVIQSKIAEIAASVLSTEDKIAQARAFMTELSLTEEEQAPWLEALA